MWRILLWRRSGQFCGQNFLKTVVVHGPEIGHVRGVDAGVGQLGRQVLMEFLRGMGRTATVSGSHVASSTATSVSGSSVLAHWWAAFVVVSGLGAHPLYQRV